MEGAVVYESHLIRNGTGTRSSPRLTRAWMLKYEAGPHAERATLLFGRISNIKGGTLLCRGENNWSSLPKILLLVLPRIFVNHRSCPRFSESRVLSVVFGKSFVIMQKRN